MFSPALLRLLKHWFVPYTKNKSRDAENTFELELNLLYECTYMLLRYELSNCLLVMG